MTEKFKQALRKTWDISDDGKVYTFHLRQGAKWNVKAHRKVPTAKSLEKRRNLWAKPLIRILLQMILYLHFKERAKRTLTLPCFFNIKYCQRFKNTFGQNEIKQAWCKSN